MLLKSVFVCVVAVSFLHLSAGNIFFSSDGISELDPSKSSLKQAFFDILLRKILRTTVLATAEKGTETLAKSSVDEPDKTEAWEESADWFTHVTRYVGVPYNILKGSPDGEFDSGGTDRGIMITQPIFEFTYDQEKTGYDSVPDQVIFHSQESCSGNSHNNIYAGAKSYQESLDYGINLGGTVFSFRFGLSASIKKAEMETAGRKHVFLDKKQICNYGEVRYRTDVPGIHKISEGFYKRVVDLPLTYSVQEYMQFIRDWGTHVIVRANVGTKNITRSSMSYTQIYQQLKKQKSGGIKFGGEYQGQGGKLELDISKINLNSNHSSSFGSNGKRFTIGTKENPYPITLTLWNISKTLRPVFWTALSGKEMTMMAQRKANLERALADYADYEDVQRIKDPVITIQFSWPNGQYALPATTSGCPLRWSQGRRTQSSGSNYDWSSGINSRLEVDFVDNTITTNYCVKTKTNQDRGIGFDWPEGSYCIARKGGHCPFISTAFGENPAPRSAFKSGSITWHDRKSLFRRKSDNSRWGDLPDGLYNKNTIVNFCCRSDGSSSTPMLLPIGKPFALYRYGDTCQAVNGTTVQEDYIQFSSKSRLFSKNSCFGAHPDVDDKKCKKDHKIYFCYYTKN